MLVVTSVLKKDKRLHLAFLSILACRCPEDSRIVGYHLCWLVALEDIDIKDRESFLRLMKE